MKVTAGLLGKISWTTVKSVIMKTFSWPRVQKWFTTHLLQRALGRNISEDEYIVLDDGKWIKMANVVKYPYFKRAIERVTFYVSYSLRVLKPNITGFRLILSPNIQ